MLLPLNIYAGVMDLESGYHNISYSEENNVLYTEINNLGREDVNKKDAEALALDNALDLAIKLGLCGESVNILTSLSIVDETGKVLPANLDDDKEMFYARIESDIINKWLFIYDNNLDISLTNIEPEKNIALLAGGEMILGEYVNIHHLEIIDKELAKKYLSVIQS